MQIPCALRCAGTVSISKITVISGSLKREMTFLTHTLSAITRYQHITLHSMQWLLPQSDMLYPLL